MRVDMHGRRGVVIHRGAETFVCPDAIDPWMKDVKGIVDGAGFILEPAKGKQLLVVGAVKDANPQAVIVKEEDILAHLRKRLPAAQIPTQVIFLEHIPRLPNGLVNRFRLARANAMAAGGPAGSTPPPSEGSTPATGGSVPAAGGAAPPAQGGSQTPVAALPLSGAW
jgi:acyl-coenzyme A synthetase/AMP-(fatty) acid ligase